MYVTMKTFNYIDNTVSNHLPEYVVISVHDDSDR